MSLVRIGQDERLEPSGIVDPVLIHALYRVHAHFRHIDGRRNSARPDIVAGNLLFTLTGQGGWQVILDIDGAGKCCFVEGQVVEFQVATLTTVRKTLRKISGDLIPFHFGDRSGVHLGNAGMVGEARAVHIKHTGHGSGPNIRIAASSPLHAMPRDVLNP